MDEAARRRFEASASRMAERTLGAVDAVGTRLHVLAGLRGDERALDAGTGTGTYALGLAPYVREVVGLDPVAELLRHARRLAEGVSNVAFVEGDATTMPFADASFDVVTCARTLHHVERPDLLVAELARVLVDGGRAVVVDQLAAADPRDAEAHDRIERLRDPSHARTLSEAEIAGLLDGAGLAVERIERSEEQRDLGAFLDLAACEGEPRRAVLVEVERLVAAGNDAGIDLRPTDAGYSLPIPVAWFAAVRRPRAT